MTSATIDVNAFISAFITPTGSPHRVWTAWRRGHFRLISSEHIVLTTLAKLRAPRLASRYPVAETELALFEALVRRDATVVALQSRDILPVTGDPEDDAVLATVRLGRAEYLVTGDRRLVNLGSHGAARILSPRDFLGALNLEPEP
jgi:uncharacterized protein